MVLNQSDTSNLSLNRCRLDGQNLQKRCIFGDARVNARDRRLEVIDCQFIDILRSAIEAATVAELTVTGCDLDVPVSSAQSAIRLLDGVERSSISGNRFARPGGGYFVFIDYKAGGRAGAENLIRIANNLVTWAGLVRQQKGSGRPETALSFIVENNRFTRTGSTLATSVTGLAFGQDKPWLTDETLGRIIVRNNVLVAAPGAYTQHMAELGAGLEDGLFENNLLIDTATGSNTYIYVDKAQRSIIRQNVFHGQRGVYLVACEESRVHNNVIWATSGWAVRWDEQRPSLIDGTLIHSRGPAQDGSINTITLAPEAYPEQDIYRNMDVLITGGAGAGQSRRITAYDALSKVASVDREWEVTPVSGDTYDISRRPLLNRIHNNVIVAEGPGNKCYYSLYSGPAQTACDNNLLYASGGAVLADMRGTLITTRANLLAMWASQAEGTVASYNDISSIIAAHPLLASPNGPDGDPLVWIDNSYRPRSESPCINAGTAAGLTEDVADADADGDTGEPLPLDLDGNARVRGCVVDIGPYELPNPPIRTVPPDLDFDCDVDENDLAMLEACSSGPTVPAPGDNCAAADLDGDLDVDQTDFGLLQRYFRFSLSVGASR